MARDISDGFKTFLERLQPLPKEREKATSHKGSVKRCLETNFACYSFVEIGSIGGGTGLRNYSDTDYFAAIPAKTLTEDSGYFLRKLKMTLKGTFWSTEGIEVNAPAVVIPFGYYASENIEITPCHFQGMIDTVLGKFPKYMIPDGKGAWIPASPPAHNAYVEKINVQLSGKLKPVIKFIKAWKYSQNVPIISFYLELRVAKMMSESIILSYDEAVFRCLEELERIELAAIRDPMGISGLIQSSKTEAQQLNALSKISTAVNRAEKAYIARLKGNQDLAFHYWRLLYGDTFPAR